MSNHRKNSMRDKVKDKKWSYLEILHREDVVHRKRRARPWETHPPTNSVGHLGRQEAQKFGAVQFHGLGNLMGLVT